MEPREPREPRKLWIWGSEVLALGLRAGGVRVQAVRL